MIEACSRQLNTDVLLSDRKVKQAQEQHRSYREPMQLSASCTDHASLGIYAHFLSAHQHLAHQYVHKKCKVTSYDNYNVFCI